MKNERGFSLIEILIVVVILGFVLVSAIGIGIKIRKSNDSRSQIAEMSDRQSVFTNQVKKDFESVGYNLKRSPENGASGLVEPLFFVSSDYRISIENNSADILRTANNGEPELRSAWGLVRGSSEISFTPQSANSNFGFRSASGNTYTFYYGGPRDFSINFSGDTVFSSDNTDEQLEQGDRITIAFDAAESDGCSMSFYFFRSEERRLLFRDRAYCDYYLQSFLSTPVSGEVSNFTLRGSWFNRLDGGEENNSLPKLPLKNGVASNVPVWIDNQGETFTLLRSDMSIDPAETLSETVFDSAGAEVELPVSPLLRGNLENGDFCLLIDDYSGKSVLGKVVKASPGKTADTITFDSLGKTNPAWDSFYSDDADYVGHSFPVGSRLVRLSPPVEYRHESFAVGCANLVRREGIAPWEQVAFCIINPLLTQDASAGQNSFTLSYSILPEDATSTEARPVSITFSPSALNAR